MFVPVGNMDRDAAYTVKFMSGLQRWM